MRAGRPLTHSGRLRELRMNKEGRKQTRGAKPAAAPSASAPGMKKADDENSYRRQP